MALIANNEIASNDAALLIPLKVWLKANGISAATAYRLAAQGKLKLVKIGRRTYITTEEARRFAASLPDYKPTPPNSLTIGQDVNQALDNLAAEAKP